MINKCDNHNFKKCCKIQRLVRQGLCSASGMYFSTINYCVPTCTKTITLNATTLSDSNSTNFFSLSGYYSLVSLQRKDVLATRV